MILKRFLLIFLFLITSFWVLQSHALVLHPEAAELAVFNKNKSMITYLRGYREKTAQLSYEIVTMNAQSGAIIKRSPLTTMKPFAATPDRFKLLARAEKGIEVVHNGTGKVLRTLPYPTRAHPQQFWRVHPAISANTGLLSLASADNKIFLIHTGTGKVIRTIDAAKLARPDSQNKLSKQSASAPIVSAMQFSPNNRLFAFETKVGGKSTLHVYDYIRQVELAKLALPRTSTSNRTIRFSKNSQQLIIFSDKHAYEGITLVDLKSKEVAVKKRHAAYLTYANFSADGSSILTYTPHNKTLLIENIKTSAMTKRIYKELPQHHKVMQSIDGSVLAFSIVKQNNREKDGFLLVNANTGAVMKHLVNN